MSDNMEMIPFVIDRKLQGLKGALCQRLEEEKDQTMIVEIVIFYSVFAVTEVNTHSCVSVGILSMSSDTYNNIMSWSMVETSSFLRRGGLPCRITLHSLFAVAG